MSNQSARSLYELIGAPLAALVDAESQAARATAQFIRSVGFDRSEQVAPQEGQAGEADVSDFGKLKMVTFRYDRPEGPDKKRTYKIQVPLLSLVPIPALQIKDAELEFFARIVANPRITMGPENTQPTKKSPAEDLEDKKMSAPPEKNDAEGSDQQQESERDHQMEKQFWDLTRGRDLKATIGRDYSSSEAGRRSSLDMQIRVKVRMEQADVPTGLSSLFHIMEQNITSTEEP
jgi:hypothetical protein